MLCLASNTVTVQLLVFFFFSWSRGRLQATAHCSASQERIVPNVASLRKDQNSKYSSDSGCESLSHHQRAVKVVTLSHFKWGQFVLREFFCHLLAAGFWIQKLRATVTGNVGFENHFSSAKLYGYKILRLQSVFQQLRRSRREEGCPPFWSGSLDWVPYNL